MSVAMDEAAHALKAMPRWGLWLNENGTKVPYQTNGQRASSTNDAHWRPFEEASQDNLLRVYSGLAFQLGDGVMGVDLDDCFVEGQLMPWAKEVVDRLASYTEVSPSGNGLKIWVGGTDIPHRRKKVLMGDGSALECYGNGRYFTFTGRTYGQWVYRENQEALDWLFETHLKLPEYEPSDGDYSTSSQTALACRIVADAPMSISGQSGHATTFDVACKLARGCAITDEGELMQWMALYNATKCQPPWSDEELQHKVQQALQKSTRPEGYMLAPKWTEEFRISTPKKATVKPQEWHTLPDELLCVGGLLGDLISYAADHARYFLPEAALLGAINVVAALAGQKFQSSHGLRTNFYSVLLAGTGSGKTASIEPLVNLMSNYTMFEGVRKSRPGTSQGLRTSLLNRPVQSVFVDEANFFFESTKSDTDQLRLVQADLLELYTSSNGTFGGIDFKSCPTPPITQPCYSVMGFCTPEGFAQHLDSEGIHSGLLGRFLVLHVRRPRVPHKCHRKPPNNKLLRQLAILTDMPIPVMGNINPTPDPHVVAFTVEAEDRLERYEADINSRWDKDDADAQGVWCRACERASRLALIRAIADNVACPEITLETMEWAIALTNFATRQMLALKDSTPDTRLLRNLEKIVDRLRKFDGECTEGRLRERSKLAGKDFADAVKEGRARGLLDWRPRQTGNRGRPSTVFFLTEAEG